MANKTNIGKINVSESQLSETAKLILNELREGKKTKKEIANKYKVDLGTIVNLSKQFNVGSIKPIIVSSEVSTVIFEDNEKEVNKGMEQNEKKYFGTISSDEGGKREKISEEIALEMGIDLEGGKLTVKEIAEKYNVSVSTVYNYKKKFGLNKTGKKKIKKKSIKKPASKKVNTKEQQEKNNDEKDKSSKPSKIIVGTKEILEVGLIKDRHKMPDKIKDYIFDSPIREDLMFNYTKLDGIVSEFLLNNIRVRKDKYNNFVGEKDLVVYTTGLTCAVGAVCKMCRLNGINLTLMHYNNKTKFYEPQIIWNDFGRSNLGAATSKYSKSILIGCKEEELKNEFYTIKIVDFTSPDMKNRNVDLYIFKDETYLWNSYSEILKEIMTEKDSKKTIYVELATLSDVRIIFKKRISQTSNFASVN